MKTLIVYGSNHGFAEKCASLLKGKLQGEVDLVNLKKASSPDISNYDAIIIGGSTYAGQIQKELKNFSIQNLEALKNKKVGFFVCGMDDKTYLTNIKNAFPEELLNKAISKEYFGGEVIFKNLNFFERFIMKKIAKTDKDIHKISEENISKLAQAINQ